MKPDELEQYHEDRTGRLVVAARRSWLRLAATFPDSILEEWFFISERRDKFRKQSEMNFLGASRHQSSKKRMKVLKWEKG